MAQRLTQAARQVAELSQRQLAAMRNRQLIDQLATSRVLEDDENAETQIESEPADAEELENSGDSELPPADPASAIWNERERTSGPPLISDLPRLARPMVRFQITENYEVRQVGNETGEIGRTRTLLALAIAEHMRRHEIVCSAPGSWVEIRLDAKRLKLVQCAR